MKATLIRPVVAALLFAATGALAQFDAAKALVEPEVIARQFADPRRTVCSRSATGSCCG